MRCFKVHVQSDMNEAVFRRTVWVHYKKHGRHELPWRKTRDPYKILVSEVMLQQTQVERVEPYYREFLKKFPTARRLAEAPLSVVLKAWQGLGYNRRAKMLHETAKVIAKSGVPKSAVALERLPGIGPYTAAAVAALAWDEPGLVLETNIRTAITHHFFPDKAKVNDKEIEAVLARVQPQGKAREWTLALMDYGAFLKRSGVRINARSKHYTRQSKFAGSSREARGTILKELAKGPQTERRLLGLLGDDRRDQLAAALAALNQEGFLARSRGGWRLS